MMMTRGKVLTNEKCPYCDNYMWRNDKYEYMCLWLKCSKIFAIKISKTKLEYLRTVKKMEEKGND